MKFAIFRELKKGKRKFLLEMDQDEIIKKLSDQFLEIRENEFRAGFLRVIEDFKK